MKQIGILSREQLTELSKLGFKSWSIFSESARYNYFIADVMMILDYFINEIEYGEDYIYYELCDCELFKKSTLLKGIYNSCPNVYGSLLIDVMKDKEKKEALLQRIKAIRYYLAAAFRYN